jgi:hypothetical protein
MIEEEDCGCAIAPRAGVLEYRATTTTGKIRVSTAINVPASSEIFEDEQLGKSLK